MRRWIRSATLVVLATALTVACSDDTEPPGTSADPGSSTTSDDDDPSAGGQGLAVDLGTPVRLIPLDLAIDSPIAASHVSGSSSVVVAGRAGDVHEVVVDGDRAELVAGPLVDLRDDVGSTEIERGLLGVAVSPDRSTLVVSYTTAQGGDSRVEAYDLLGEPGALRVEESSRRTLLEADQPYPNHNGGHVEFDPDGLLFVGLGDGGAAGDPHGNAQDPTTLLGKILRIDPRAPATPPADNPYVDAGGGVRPEIWLTGVRNPWRFSFDPATGDLWIGDVGQDEQEEIDLLPAADGAGRGANLGWDLREGDLAFDDADPAPSPWSDGPFVEPLLTYGREDGCSVTGGVVYRGEAIPRLSGAYLFGDYCGDGVRGLVPDAASPAAQELAGARMDRIVAFAAGPGGEVLVLSLSDGIALLAPG